MQDDWKLVELHVETLYSSWNSCRIWRLRSSTGISLPLFLEKFYLVELEILKYAGWIQICMFSLLKRWKYSLYSDTMLNIGYKHLCLFHLKCIQYSTGIIKPSRISLLHILVLFTTPNNHHGWKCRCKSHPHFHHGKHFWANFSEMQFTAIIWICTSFFCVMS